MSENRVLTDAELKNLTPGDHPDGLVPGLVFRLRETGGDRGRCATASAPVSNV